MLSRNGLTDVVLLPEIFSSYLGMWLLDWISREKIFWINFRLVTILPTAIRDVPWSIINQEYDVLLLSTMIILL